MTAMTGRRGGLAAMTLTVYVPSMLFGMGQGAIQPVIAISALDLGASVAVAGLVVAVAGIGRIVGDVPAGWLAERIGERRAMLASLAVYVAGAAVCATARSIVLLTAGVAAIGMANSVFGLARQSYVTESVPFERRGRGLSMLGGMLRVGQFVGPFLGAATMTLGGLVASYWLAAGAGLLAAAVLLVVGDPLDASRTTRRHEPSVARVVSIVVRENLPVLRTLGLGMLLVGAARASRQVALPLWADHIGLGPATTSIVFGLSALMETVLFYPAGLAMDRLGRRLVVVGSMSLLALSLVAMPFTGTAVTLGAAAAVMGLGNGLGSGINMTVGADASPAVGRAAFLGVFRLFGDVGNGLGPVLVSVVTAVSTLGAAIVAAGATAALAALLLSRWLPRHPRPDLVAAPE